MTGGLHPEQLLDLAGLRGAELQADARRYRLVRQARARAARARTEAARKQPGAAQSPARALS